MERARKTKSCEKEHGAKENSTKEHGAKEQIQEQEAKLKRSRECEK